MYHILFAHHEQFYNVFCVSHSDYQMICPLQQYLLSDHITRVFNPQSALFCFCMMEGPVRRWVRFFETYSKVSIMLPTLLCTENFIITKLTSIQHRSSYNFNCIITFKQYCLKNSMSKRSTYGSGHFRIEKYKRQFNQKMLSDRARYRVFSRSTLELKVQISEYNTEDSENHHDRLT